MTNAMNWGGDKVSTLKLNPTTELETVGLGSQNLYRIAGAAALMAGALFLVALVDLVIAGVTSAGWLSLLQDNWLVVLFQLNAGLNAVRYDLLNQLNLLDMAILALTATMYLGLYAALRRTSRIGAIIAALQPFLGLVLFIATKSAGRSAVMGAALVISLVMLRSHIFGKAIASLGILASLLLLVGDLGTTPDSPSNLLAISIGIGYVLLATWFLLIGARLLHLEQSVSRVRALASE